MKEILVREKGTQQQTVQIFLASKFSGDEIISGI